MKAKRRIGRVRPPTGTGSCLHRPVEPLERRRYLSAPAPLTFEEHIYTEPNVAFGAPAVADFNQDGKDDVIVPAQMNSDDPTSEAVQALVGGAQGALTLTQTIPDPSQGVGDPTGGDDSLTVVTGDFFRSGAGIGRSDAIVYSHNDDRLLQLQSAGDGTFSSSYSTPIADKEHIFLAAAGNFIGGDGFPDLITSGRDTINAGGATADTYLLFYRGDDAANFEEASPASAYVGSRGFVDQYELLLADLNNDGKLDLVTLGSQNGALVNYALGNGDGTFQWGSQGQDIRHLDAPDNEPMAAISVADVNGDGKPDIVGAEGYVDHVTGKVGYGLVYWLGNGDGTFQPFVSYPSPDFINNAVVDDFNGDGIPDVVASLADDGESGRDVFVYPGLGNGAFGQPIPVSTSIGEIGGGVEVGDFNGDGKPDILLGKSNGEDVLLNTTVFPGRVTGRVYNDYNADGVFTPGLEQPLSGRTVYVDLNNNRTQDPNEPATTTDSSGNYSFTLQPGTHHVRQVLPAGWHQTTPATSLTNIYSGAQVVTVAQMKTTAGADFGQTQLGGLSGRVYYDNVGDGIERDADPAQAGVTVYVDLNNNGARDSGEPAAVSDSQGNWSIPNLYPQYYVVRVDIAAGGAAGYTVTGPVPPAGSSNGYYYTRVYGGFPGGDADFGVILPSLISGQVYNDANGNGKPDPGEAGLASRYVFLDLNGNGQDDLEEPYALTDSNGNYTLRTPQAPPTGTYTLKAIPHSGYNPTAPAGGAYALTFAPGSTTTGKNFGFTSGALSNAGFQPPANFVSHDNPYGVATGDFNKDGFEDFAAVNTSGNVALFKGDGTGHFTSTTVGVTGGSPRAIAAADLNHDGKLDLVAANQDDSNVSVLLGNGDGTFQAAVNYPAATAAYALVVADFNGDGIKDIAVVGQSDNMVDILPGNGDGTFQTARTFGVDFGGLAVAAADLNGDGKMDLVSAQSQSGDLAVLINTSSYPFMTFKPAALLGGSYGIFSPRSVAVADVNGDKKQDLVVTSEFSDDVVVLLGNGDGTFTPPTAARTFATGSDPAQVVVADADGDGKPDLLVAYRSDGTTNISGGVNFFRGHGDGTFDNALTSTAHTSPVAVAEDDFNGDGLPDLLAANLYSDDVSVMLNARLANASIGGTVFSDANGNGILDPGESGLSGVQVFLDSNGNGALDAGETAVTTDASGNYSFPNLTPGGYTVREVVPAGYARVAPADGQLDVTLASGASPAGNNFADVPLEVAAAPGGAANHIIVQLNAAGDHIQVFDNTPVTGNPVLAVPVALGVPLALDGGAAGDTLTLDLSVGAPFPLGGLTFKAGAGPLAVSVSGPGTLNWGTDLSIQSSGAGPAGPAVSLAVTNGAVVNFPAAVQFTSLSLSGSSRVSLAPGGAAPLQLGALSVADSSSLDVADNSVTIQYGAGPNPSSSIEALIAGGALLSSAAAPGAGVGSLDNAAAQSVLIALAPGVEEFDVNFGTSQRSIVNALDLQFTAAVNAGPGAFSLALLTTDSDGNVTGSTDVSNSVTWSSQDGGVNWEATVVPGSSADGGFGSLADGIYRVTVHAAAFASTFTGLPLAGGDQSFAFHRLFADSDGNGTVNALDYARFKQVFGSSIGGPTFNPTFDFDGNGTINALDYAQFKKRFGMTFTYT